MSLCFACHLCDHLYYIVETVVYVHPVWFLLLSISSSLYRYYFRLPLPLLIINFITLNCPNNTTRFICILQYETLQVGHCIIPGSDGYPNRTHCTSTTVAIATTANDISEVYPNRTHCIPDYCTVAIVTIQLRECS